MSRLTEGMYKIGCPPGLFSLQFDQYRRYFSIIVSHAYWFNPKGELLGIGDLDANDFRRIAEELEEGEIFIICSQSLGYRKTMTKDDIFEKCWYVILPDQAYIVNEYKNGQEDEYRKINKYNFKFITPDEVKRMCV